MVGDSRYQMILPTGPLFVGQPVWKRCVGTAQIGPPYRGARETHHVTRVAKRSKLEMICGQTTQCAKYSGTRKVKLNHILQIKDRNWPNFHLVLISFVSQSVCSTQD